MGVIDLTNQKFGRWTVLYRADKKGSKGQVYWHCKCECGNEKDIDGCELRRGGSKSCGCLRKERVQEANTKNLIGQRFGKLTVIEKTDKRSNNRFIVWKCKCDCGNICEVISSSLKNGHTKSCGCLNSKGELKIIQILKNHNILFETQKTFENCKFKDTNYLAKFDFYINNKYIIEFDGIQHFKIEGWNTQENFIKVKEHDDFKNKYCKEHNIPF